MQRMLIKPESRSATYLSDPVQQSSYTSALGSATQVSNYSEKNNHKKGKIWGTNLLKLFTDYMQKVPVLEREEEREKGKGGEKRKIMSVSVFHKACCIKRKNSSLKQTSAHLPAQFHQISQSLSLWSPITSNPHTLRNGHKSKLSIYLFKLNKDQKIVICVPAPCNAQASSTPTHIHRYQHHNFTMTQSGKSDGC